MSETIGDPHANAEPVEESDDLHQNEDAKSADEVDPEETAVLGEDAMTDNVGDVSVEINVEQLIADIEEEGDQDAARKKEIRRRLEDMAEEKSFEDTYAIDTD